MARRLAENVLFSEESLCNDGPSVLKSKGIMLKNYVNVSFLFVLK
jgi:hypothetical protein